MATQLQEQIAKLCGVSVEGLSKRAAAARLRMVLVDEILDVFPGRETTDSQKDLAQQLRLPNLSSHLEIAALQIEAELLRLNEEAMEKHGFTRGMRVRFVGGQNVHGLSHEIGADYLISTVKPDGRIYLRETSGAPAYASQLEPVA